MRKNLYLAIIFVVFLFGIPFAAQLPLFFCVSMIYIMLVCKFPAKIMDGDYLQPFYLYNIIYLVFIYSCIYFVKFARLEILSRWVFHPVLDDKSLAVWFAGLVFFNVGYKLVQSGKHGASFKVPAAFSYLVIIASMLILVAQAINIMLMGVPLLTGIALKHSDSHGMLLSLFLAPFLLTPVFLVHIMCTTRDSFLKFTAAIFIAVHIVFCVLITTITLLIPLALAVLYRVNYYKKKMSARRIVICGLVVFVLITSSRVLRGSISQEISKRSEYVSDRIVFSLFNNQYEKLVQYNYLTSNDNNENGFYLLFSGAFQLMPGKQISDDRIFRRLIYGRPTVAPMAVPFNAVLYFVGGVGLQFVGMVSLGFVTALVYYCFMSNRNNLIWFSIYCYWTYALLVKTIYANLFSRAETFIILGFFAFLIILFGRNKYVS